MGVLSGSGLPINNNGETCPPHLKLLKSFEFEGTKSDRWTN
jgi:hypothetical protein